MNKRAGKIHALCETRRTSNARRVPKIISLSVPLSLTDFSQNTLIYCLRLASLETVTFCQDWMYLFDDVFRAKKKPFSGKTRKVIVDVVTFLF